MNYFYNLIRFLLITVVVIVFVAVGNSQISGTVFRDFNGDGVKQAGEPGKDRINVYAYSNAVAPNKDALVAQAVTDANGNYTVNSPVYPVRLEFIIPDGFCNMASDEDFPSANLTAGTNTSEVQIADNGETHNFGIVYPPDFATNDNPRTFLPRFTTGDGLAGGTSSENPAFISFPYKAKGVAPNGGRGNGTGDNIPFDIMALNSQLGTVHGVAYSRQAKKVFTSAFLKRHAGLGPLGGGGIYWLNPEPPYDLNANLKFMDFDELGIPTSDEVNPYTDNPAGSTANKVMFSPVIGTNVERGLSPDKTQPSHDRAAWTQIGKVSFGDLEISEDGRYLYVINLYDRKLYEIDLTDPFNPVAPTIANAVDKIHGYQIPDPCVDNANGEYRPFALKVSRGKVYVGVTCSGQDIDGNTVAASSADITSSVLEFDLTTHVFDPNPMLIYDYSYRDNDKQWHPWSNEWVGDWEYGYPLLADIEFDNNGNVLLGIKDLRGDMMGHQNYTLNPNSTSLSSIATVGELLNAVRDASAPSCEYNIQVDPEFYNDNLIHTESSQGALAVHHTSSFDGVLSTFLDPVSGHVWAGGVMLYNNQDGSQVNSGQGYEVFWSSNNGMFGKANGLGDLETMEVIPPIEIGNIVWLDKDKDGVQDADEEGIAGVIVELVKNGVVVSTTTTDALGTYYFNFTNTNNGEGPEPNTDYVVRISSTQFNNGIGSGPLDSKSLTLTDESGNGQSDWSDNDASDVGGVVQLNLTTGDSGENNHSYDFGFKEIFDLALTKLETSSGPYRYGDQVTFTYTVYNQGYIAATNIEVTDYVPSGFEYNPILNPLWSQGQTNTPKTTISSILNHDESATVNLILTLKNTADQENGWINRAEISRAEDIDGNDMSNEDWDSILDDDPLNDAGGNPDTDSDNSIDGDGTGSLGDTDALTDEDDADPARVKVYDLALRKTVVTLEPYHYYQDLTFEITVFNQGNVVMTDVEVSDYIPSGYTFDSGANAGWSGAAPTVKTTIPGPIAVGDSAKVQLVLKLVQTNGGATEWDNYAEITAAKDDEGNDATTWDADSTTGTDATHERAVKPDDIDDDNIDGHYLPDGTDEDDHDPAGVKVLDLALTKTAGIQPPFHYDQIVDFVFTIYNQGNEVAHDIEVTDYVPSGFIYLPHLNTNPEWTQALTDKPSTVIPGNLAPGASITVTIKLQFQYTTEVGGYINKGEISSAKDEDDNIFDDIDSTPDDDPDNDTGGTVDSPEDDNVSDDGQDGDGDGITDEDDEDPWGVEVASIGNYVWYDDNDNGLQDDGNVSQVGVEGVTVILQDCNGNEQLRTQTDANGHYDFANLIPGEYEIVFEDIPENSIWAKQNQGGNDALDSDSDDTGMTFCTTLDPGEDDPTWDAGILRLSSLGDYVWLDENADGVQDQGESAISGVVVKLYDEQGNVIETTTTDEQGYYLFDSLRPGTYVVEFVNPGGLDYSPLNQGGDSEKDSDASPTDGKTTDIVLGADEDRRDIDAGFTCTLEVSASSDETICEGSTIDLLVTITGGQDPKTILWTTGATTSTISVSPEQTSTYGVTVTDKYGCEDSDEVVVTVEPKAKIGDYVWLDLDRDGIQDFYIQDPDLAEPGINGVRVNLYKSSDPNTVYMTQITHVNADTSGYYEFEVCSGDYFVEFIAPTGEGYIFTQQDQGTDDTLDSDADENTGRTIATHLDPEEVDHTWDAGFYKTASIGDLVWHDIDADGIQDPGEEGIDGVEVTLHRADGSVVGTTTTANGGLYEFTGLLPDDYYVCFDYSGTIYTQVSPQNQGVNDEEDSDVDENSGCTEITTIVSGENDVTWDMGLYSLASLGDYVWYDTDGDGCQDAGEQGIEGVIVRLYQDTDANGVPDGVELANTQTDNTGFYQFTNLEAGTYLVKFEKPNTAYKVSPKNHNGAMGCDDTRDSDGNTIFGYSDPIPLVDNEHDPTIDQGYYESARLGDYVWYDSNGDGIQDPTEEGVSGVTVTLYKDTDGDGIPDTAVETKVTNTGIDAGGYVFEDVDPGVYKICFDTDGDYDGFTQTNTGGDDAKDSDVDQNTGCTEIIVVESGDDNMTNDAGLIKTAELGDYVWEDKNADGIQDPTEDPIEGVVVKLRDTSGNPVEDADGNVVADKLTDVNGKYLFDNLLPGEYVVVFEKPNGYEPTDSNKGTDDAKDSDANKVTGESHVVTLEAGDSDLTIDAGYYKPASLGDYAWEDKDADGVQDPGEDGINGIVVTLYDENGDPVSNTTTGINPDTGEDGFYEFTGLKPGTYYVCFDKGSYDNISDNNQGGNASMDSNADPVTGCTEMTVLESGENDPTIDAGIYDYASLGDYVWLDEDADGVQDINEAGINGVTVILYSDEDGNGNPDGAPLATTTTSNHNGNDGYYIFDNLEPGKYVVLFPTLDEYELTDADKNGDDTKDSDASTVTGISPTVDLESGEHDPTIDAGYFNAASLGDFVWYDEDGDGIQDATEKCIDSVKIYLYNVVNNGGVLDTIKLDSTWSHAVVNPNDDTDTLQCGFYEFTRLKPGDYFLVFENPDDTQYQISPRDELFDDSKDTDINDFGNTPTITLAGGEDNPTIDAGFYKGECLEGLLWKDREDGYCEIMPDLTQLCAILNVYDELDEPFVNIVVELYSDPDENDPFDDVLVMSTTTDANGVYDFTNIKKGDYYLVVKLPDEYAVVNTDVGGDDNVDSDFYLSEETGLYRSYTFFIDANNEEECISDVDAGTKKQGTTQPMELLSFEASWNTNDELVEIVWNTMNEVDLDYFTVERRADDEEEYVEIAVIDAKGGRFASKYGLKDPNVEDGMTYHYRLIPMNINGRSDRHYTAKVYIPASKFTVKTYPNPIQDRMYVLISGNRDNDVSIEILDNVGRRVMEKVMIEKTNTSYEKVSMNLRDLPQGQYYIKVVSGQRVEIKKLVHVK